MRKNFPKKKERRKFFSKQGKNMENPKFLFFIYALVRVERRESDRLEFLSLRRSSWVVNQGRRNSLELSDGTCEPNMVSGISFSLMISIFCSVDALNYGHELNALISTQYKMTDPFWDSLLRLWPFFPSLPVQLVYAFFAIWILSRSFSTQFFLCLQLLPLVRND